MRRTILSTALVLALVATYGCAADSEFLTSPDESAALNKTKVGGGGTGTLISLQAAWSNEAGLGVRGDSETSSLYGDSPTGTSTYVKGDCGVGAHTYSGHDQAGWFDVQPTNYKDSDPSCLRWLEIGGHRPGEITAQRSDVEVHVWGMTSVASTTSGELRRVGMGIQTEAVKAALGCDRLIYDANAYDRSKYAAQGESARIALISGTTPRSWKVEGTWAWCENVSSRGGKLSTTGGRYYPFSFTMTER